MRVRFWGTRGSIPVATSGRTIRAKIAHALHLAQGRRFGSDEERDSHTWGWQETFNRLGEAL